MNISEKYAQNYLWLDLIRGISALLVFLGHLRILFFAETSPAQLDLFGKLFYFVTGFGHEAVVVFFVLSGFFIIKSIDGLVSKNKWSTINYVNNRFTRLWVVLVPALIAGFILDRFGFEYFSNSLGYLEKIKYWEGINMKDNMGFTTFLGNAFFLQNIIVPPFGSNGAVWSLSLEFWFYIAFPLFYFSIKNQEIKHIRVIYFMLGCTVLIMLGWHKSSFFLIWLLGGLSYLIQKNLSKIKLKHIWTVTLLVIFFIMLVLIRFKKYPYILNDYSLGFIFALLVPMLTFIKMKNQILQYVSYSISRISYTLYLVHLPFVLFLTSALTLQVKPWGYRNFGIFMLVVFATVAYSIFFWYLFERNTDKVKKFIISVCNTNLFARRKHKLIVKH